MSPTKTSQKPENIEINDNNTLQYLLRQKSISENVIIQPIRAFSWFPNSSVPKSLQPLLNQYLNISKYLLRDPRDVIFLTHILVGLSTVVISGLFLLYSFSIPRLILHAILVISQASPFVLMLHCVCHRPLFKKNLSLLDGLVTYVLAPFFGHTWNTFYYHHIKHHHVEDNGPDDLSSTIKYQRDSFLGFCFYFLRFLLLIWIELPLYFVKKAKYDMALGCLISEVGCLVTFIGLLVYSPNYLGVLSVIWLPFILMRFGMMSGNWGQHSMVDASNPQNDYKSSITCISNTYNNLCFNDGYHTTHHLNSQRHWQDLPEHVVKNMDKFKSETAIIFKGIDFHGVWFCLMMKDYDTLAKAFVQLSEPGDKEYLSKGQIIDFLKSRTRKLTAKEIAIAYPKAK